MNAKRNSLDTPQKQKLTIWLHSNPDFVKSHSDAECAAEAQKALGYVIVKGNISGPRFAMYPEASGLRPGTGTSGLLHRLNTKIDELSSRVMRLESELGVTR